MTTQTTECVVHNRKYLSKFHANINQLRRTNQFNVTTLQQLPKRYCSCHGKTGESLFDLNHLRQLCQEIESAILSNPVKPIDYVVLEFVPTLTPIQRLYMAGRFVGRGGQHLQLIQRTLNVSINIVNIKSNKTFRQIVDKLKEQNKETSKDGLWLLITMKNSENDIEKIKQSLENQWKKIDVITKKKQSKKLRFPRQEILASTSISKDTRWKPKKAKARDKHKSKETQFDLQEVQPQPFVRPISMPKEITTSQKIKRK